LLPVLLLKTLCSINSWPTLIPTSIGFVSFFLFLFWCSSIIFSHSLLLSSRLCVFWISWKKIKALWSVKCVIYTKRFRSMPMYDCVSFLFVLSVLICISLFLFFIRKLNVWKESLARCNAKSLLVTMKFNESKAINKRWVTLGSYLRQKELPIVCCYLLLLLPLAPRLLLLPRFEALPHPTLALRIAITCFCLKLPLHAFLAIYPSLPFLVQKWATLEHLGFLTNRDVTLPVSLPISRCSWKSRNVYWSRLPFLVFCVTS
jgi:hypothetical protein